MNFLKSTLCLFLSALLLFSCSQAGHNEEASSSAGDSTMMKSDAMPDATAHMQIGASAPVGTVVAFAGSESKIPDGWKLCDGTSLKRQEYRALFNTIGTNWGGTADDEFNIPDLRGVFLRGVDGDANNDPDHDSRLTSLNNGVRAGNKVGSYQPDAFQGHWHNIGNSSQQNMTTRGLNPTGGRIPASDNASGKAPVISNATAPVSDGSNGEPRSSGETRAKNAYVNFIIRCR